MVFRQSESWKKERGCRWLYGTTGMGPDLWMKKNGRRVGAADTPDIGKPVTTWQKHGW